MVERVHRIMMDQVRVVPVARFELRLPLSPILVKLKPKAVMHRVIPVCQELVVEVVLLFSQKD